MGSISDRDFEECLKTSGPIRDAKLLLSDTSQIKAV